jgi:hypothetical protein
LRQRARPTGYTGDGIFKNGGRELMLKLTENANGVAGTFALAVKLA